jgi:hypothetical protein
MDAQIRSLLLLCCSERKRTDPDPLPALERYDGPAFRVVRRWAALAPRQSRDIRILSAEFGLIAADQRIPYYDQRMTVERATSLRSQIRTQLKRIFDTAQYAELFIYAGARYLMALDSYQEVVPKSTVVRVASGSIGGKLAQLHDWLYGHPPLQPTSSAKGPFVKLPRQRYVLRGRSISMTVPHILDVARRGMREDEAAAQRYQSWYVVVDGKRVAPKWLVSRMTGLPAGLFSTSEARRLLTQLGIEVRRV